MAEQKKEITTYKRDKNKVEISGEPENVKLQIWFDMVANELRWIVPVIILLIVVPKAFFIPILLKWIKHVLPLLILFVVIVDYAQIFLSG